MHNLHDPLDRRDFLKTTTTAAALTAAASLLAPAFGQKPAAPLSPITMSPLPYALSALEPTISAKTVDLHYNKHHKGYYTSLMDYISGHEAYQNRPLSYLMFETQNGILIDESVHTLAVLFSNHTFYWNSLIPSGGKLPESTSVLGQKILKSFGSADQLKKRVLEEAMKIGVGWVWIAQDSSSLKAIRTQYHETPQEMGLTPLLCIDVWEHAYYLDYQDQRAKYVDAVFTNLLNWKFAESNLKA